MIKNVYEAHQRGLQAMAMADEARIHYDEKFSLRWLALLYVREIRAELMVRLLVPRNRHEVATRSIRNDATLKGNLMSLFDTLSRLAQVIFLLAVCAVLAFMLVAFIDMK